MICLKPLGKTVISTCLAALVLPGAAVAQDLPDPERQPILRPDMGMHNSVVNRIDTDRERRFMVSASDDKTIRVWSLPDLEPIRVLRVPVGSNPDDGKVYSVAISPDGSTVAAAGWDAADTRDTNEHGIYLFDRASGRLMTRLGGHENVILDLAFSDDGEHVAAGIGGRNGVRIWRISDREMVASDDDYDGQVYGLRWSPKGGFATTSYDGCIRLYSKSFQRTRKVCKLIEGRPYDIAFSPDGSRLAIGYVGNMGLKVLSADTLKVVHTPKTELLTGDGGDLSALEWSDDGKTLIAGGKYNKKDSWKNPLVLFSNEGRGDGVGMGGERHPGGRYPQPAGRVCGLRKRRSADRRHQSVGRNDRRGRPADRRHARQAARGAAAHRRRLRGPVRTAIWRTLAGRLRRDGAGTPDRRGPGAGGPARAAHHRAAGHQLGGSQGSGIRRQSDRSRRLRALPVADRGFQQWRLRARHELVAAAL